MKCLLNLIKITRFCFFSLIIYEIDLYAVLYDIMYDSTEQILYHYVLNLFILLYNNEQSMDDSKVDRQINAVKFDDNWGSVGLNALNRTLHK